MARLDVRSVKARDVSRTAGSWNTMAVEPREAGTDVCLRWLARLVESIPLIWS